MRIKTNTMQYRDPNTGEFVSIPIVVSEPKEEKFELIEEFETTEEIASFVRTAEPDGTPYDFQKIKVIIFQPVSISNGNGGIICTYGMKNLGNAYFVSTTKPFDKTYPTFSQYNAYIENGKLKGDAVTISGLKEVTNIESHIFDNGYNSGNVSRPLFSVFETINLDKIDRLSYKSLNNYPIPIGTKIQIYAVRS